MLYLSDVNLRHIFAAISRCLKTLAYRFDPLHQKPFRRAVGHHIESVCQTAKLKPLKAPLQRLIPIDRSPAEACARRPTMILSPAETASLRAIFPQKPLQFLRIQAIRDLAEVHKADRAHGQKFSP